MEKKSIGIVIIATNAYLVLGIRFIKRFLHHYKGNCDIKFFIFTDRNPYEYLGQSEIEHVITIHTQHTSWVDGTNSKFKNILTCPNVTDYLFYFDADTNIVKDFDDWFIGDLVGGEHFGSRTFLNGGKFDQNAIAMSYVPKYTELPIHYYYGAFFGGSTSLVRMMCTMMKNWQLTDKIINYEPPVNDESYINKYFHFVPPKMITIEQFNFVVSDKGGIGETRTVSLNIEHLLSEMKALKNKIYNIQNGKITYDI